MFQRDAPVRRPQGFIEPCIPIFAKRPPAGPQWIHEIKHDGFRLIVSSRGGRVRLFRQGYDWTDHYPLIAAAAAALPAHATIDGYAGLCDGDGIADFTGWIVGSTMRLRSYGPLICWSSTARICGRGGSIRHPV